MKVALVNPHWHFARSIYFGCQSEHLPLELGYAATLLQQSGHDVLMLDGRIMGLDQQGLVDRVAEFAPDMTVLTTAPTYLFWRCTQPEITVPLEFLQLLGPRGGLRVLVGPHGSVTPQAVLKKLPADVVIRGECEEAIVEIANTESISALRGLAIREGDRIRVGFSPSVRLFEAAAAGAPIISDSWEGIDSIFDPGREICLASGRDDVLACLDMTEPERMSLRKAARARFEQAHLPNKRACDLEAFVAEVNSILRPEGASCCCP